jgi:hypothetical protein
MKRVTATINIKHILEDLCGVREGEDKFKSELVSDRTIEIKDGYCSVVDGKQLSPQEYEQVGRIILALKEIAGEN